MNRYLTAGGALQHVMMIAVITITMVLVQINPAHAAEVLCAQSWGTEANDAYIPNWYHSGRRPNAATCRVVLIRENIEGLAQHSAGVVLARPAQQMTAPPLLCSHIYYSQQKPNRVRDCVIARGAPGQRCLAYFVKFV
jgi:hypothetical protein